MPVLAMIVAALVGAAFAVWVTRMSAGRKAQQALVEARAAAGASLQEARINATVARRAATTGAREHGLVLRQQADQEFEQSRRAAVDRTTRASAELAEAQDVRADLDAKHGAIDERAEEVKRLRDSAKGLFADVDKRDAEAIGALEEQSGESSEAVTEALSHRWLEDATAAAAARVRAIDLGQVADAQYDEVAKRLLEISVARYRNHFLTERSISKLPLTKEVLDVIMDNDGLVHQSIERVSNVQLQVDESGDFLRLDGLDGVGREVARRAINRLTKKPNARTEVIADPDAWGAMIRSNLDREITTLGKKAFKVLQVELADPEIVQLVGALNYRTSYTQNQWLHAVEAAFLCGMIAEELGLDYKLARRATLMHDIGKALTHQIEGSHAVIGAEIARRLGEDEVIANAIGAHHLDEPMNSPYAFLVAAADAMSGARPGARREFEGGYTTRLGDLERIGQSFRGVERAYAVHGGRELRVYVADDRVSDLDAVSLSANIAEQVSDEMTFPGQIKVTVIRAFEAVSTAN